MNIFDPALLWRAAPALVDALGNTLLLTIGALAIAIVAGFVLYLLTLSKRRISRTIAAATIATSRAVPEIVAIFWAYYCLPILFGIRLSGMACGILVLGLIGAGYVAEIVRGAIGAISRQQWEAATALALPRRITWTRVILPQAVPNMLAPMLNYLTDLLKATTLVAGIGVAEVAYAAYLQGAETYHYVEPLSAVALVFFALIFPLSLAARRLEQFTKAK